MKMFYIVRQNTHAHTLYVQISLHKTYSDGDVGTCPGSYSICGKVYVNKLLVSIKQKSYAQHIVFLPAQSLSKKLDANRF